MMVLREFVNLLKDPHDQGDGSYLACCPAHDDSTPSLSVREGRDGKILVKCFAGCTAEQVVGAMGLKMSDVMGEDKELPKKRKGPGKMVAAYQYRDASGSLVYEVCRFEPKTFRLRVPDPDSPYKYSWGFSRYHREPVLYRLPEVLEACKAGRGVFLVEGEKDADALAGLGVCATTAHGGAQKEWLDSYTESLRGARCVIICADNDPKVKGANKDFYAGQRRAWRVGKQLEEAGLKVLRMVFPGEGVKDAYDWIQRTKPTKDDLGLLVREYLDGSRSWPDEWRFEDRAEEGGLLPAPPDKETVTYKLTKDVSLEIEILPESTIKESISYWTYRAFEALEGDVPKQVRMEIAALVCVRWLVSHGQMFWDSSNKVFAASMYFYEETGHLLIIRSDAFMGWLAAESGINMSTTLFSFVMAAVDEAAVNPSLSHGVVPSNLWDRRGDVLYVSCGNSRMARVSEKGVEMVQNGTDDVVFLEGRTLEEWKLLPDGGIDPFDNAKLFVNAAFESPYGRDLTRLWVLGLFACHKTKPVICFTGQFQSGKTRTAKGVCEILGIPNRMASIKDNGELDFWVSLNSGGLICFDNVDSRVKWFPDAMQAASTGGSTEVRRMYTHDMQVLSANASVMLTSNTPQFANESGLSDRLIIVRLTKARTVSDDKGLSEDFRKHRDASMTWIIRTLAKALADHGEVEQGVNMRHPDFADFAMRCGRSLSDGSGGNLYERTVSALRSAELDKHLFTLQNDRTAEQILEVLKEAGPGWKGNSAEMSAAIAERLELSEEEAKKFYGGRKIGNTIAKYADQFRKIAGLERYSSSGHAITYMASGGVLGEFQTLFSVNSQGSGDLRIKAESAPVTHLTPFYGEKEKEEEEDENNGGGGTFEL